MPAARRVNHRSRIRPARQRPSRARVGLVAVAVLVVVGLAATGLGRRRVVAAIDLDPSGPHRLTSSAGPVEVSIGPTARLDYRASWLLRGPEVTTTVEPDRPGIVAASPARRPAVSVDVSCPTRLPCRASTGIRLRPGAVLDVRSSGGPVLVGRFDGDLDLLTAGDHEVVLGPVGGTILVATERGDVVGHGLTAAEVGVATDGGEVRLHFRERPRAVDVVAGEGVVVIELPPGPYAVTVEGSPAATIEVEQDQTADSRISVAGPGPVRITTRLARPRPEPASPTTAPPTPAPPTTSPSSIRP